MHWKAFLYALFRQFQCSETVAVLFYFSFYQNSTFLLFLIDATCCF